MLQTHYTVSDIMYLYRAEVLTAVVVKSIIFWHVTLCRVVEVYCYTSILSVNYQTTLLAIAEDLYFIVHSRIKKYISNRCSS
jgi:hypothetical protein